MSDAREAEIEADAAAGADGETAAGVDGEAAAGAEPADSSTSASSSCIRRRLFCCLEPGPSSLRATPRDSECDKGDVTVMLSSVIRQFGLALAIRRDPAPARDPHLLLQNLRMSPISTRQ